MAAGGYPGNYQNGKVIYGLENVSDDVVVFHAGTELLKNEKESDGELLVGTKGGRVLGVTARGKTHEEARSNAYENVRKISFEGAQYRKDIGRI
jgi:phosphoribosylamine--glycine ligase